MSCECEEKLKAMEERIAVLETIIDETILSSTKTTPEDIYLAYKERCRERRQGERG